MSDALLSLINFVLYRRWLVFILFRCIQLVNDLVFMLGKTEKGEYYIRSNYNLDPTYQTVVLTLTWSELTLSLLILFKYSLQEVAFLIDRNIAPNHLMWTLFAYVPVELTCIFLSGDTMRSLDYLITVATTQSKPEEISTALVPYEPQSALAYASVSVSPLYKFSAVPFLIIYRKEIWQLIIRQFLRTFIPPPPIRNESNSDRTPAMTLAPMLSTSHRPQPDIYPGARF